MYVYIYIYISVYLPCSNRQMKRAGHDVPAEIQTMWNKAVGSNCKAAKTMLFQKWLSCGKDYSQLRVQHSYISFVYSYASHLLTKNPILPLTIPSCIYIYIYLSLSLLFEPPL